MIDRMNTQRERKRTANIRFVQKIFICLENIISKFERFSYNLMENKKDTGILVCSLYLHLNKRGSKMKSKIFTSVNSI